MVSAPPAGRVPATPLQIALRWCRGGLLGVTVFNAAANVLLLLAPVYILQISDRGLPSASHVTLIALTGVAVFLLHPWLGVLALLSTPACAGVGRVDGDAVAGAVPLGFAENGLRHADVLAAIVT